jgi:hypothetical protein
LEAELHGAFEFALRKQASTALCLQRLQGMAAFSAFIPSS